VLITRPDNKKIESPCWQRGYIFLMTAQTSHCSSTPSHWLVLRTAVRFIKRDWKESAQS